MYKVVVNKLTVFLGNKADATKFGNRLSFGGVKNRVVLVRKNRIDSKKN